MATQALFSLPLDEMQKVATRVALTGTLTGQSHNVPVDAQKARNQVDLIGAAIRYRQTAMGIGLTNPDVAAARAVAATPAPSRLIVPA